MYVNEYLRKQNIYHLKFRRVRRSINSSRSFSNCKWNALLHISHWKSEANIRKIPSKQLDIENTGTRMSANSKDIYCSLVKNLLLLNIILNKNAVKPTTISSCSTAATICRKGVSFVNLRNITKACSIARTLLTIIIIIIVRIVESISPIDPNTFIFPLVSFYNRFKFPIT